MGLEHSPERVMAFVAFAAMMKVSRRDDLHISPKLEILKFNLYFTPFGYGWSCSSSKRFVKGDALPTTFRNDLHTFENTGTEVAQVLVFYAGAVGLPTS